MSMDRVDLEARRKAARIIHEKFMKVAEQIMKGEPPRLEIPKRTLRNVRFDPEKGILVMGEEKIQREFLKAGEARRFMQTLLMASIIYQALLENEYPTIRDLYYRGKHTIFYRTLKGKLSHIETWEEQKESDQAIMDVEVFTGLLREEMLILSKEKGKVVGRMKIRSGSDVIDLSKMGHGAYAIESTPDLIEILDVDADFVLVVEKDAVFQQLHRYKFWDKYRAILITGAGQPDRATRRFVHRLHYEQGLPVYILTDSIPADEVVVVRDPVSGKVMIGPVEEIVGRFFSGFEKERVVIPLEVLSWNQKSGKIAWSRVGYVYRHKVREPILKIKTKNRGVIRVTKAHSLFAVRNGKVEVLPAKDLRPGDRIVVANRLPPITKPSRPILVLAEILAKAVSHHDSKYRLENSVKLLVNGKWIRLREAGREELYSAESIKLSRSKWEIPNKIHVDEDLAWLLGVLAGTGVQSSRSYLIINLGMDNIEIIERIASILRERFNIESKIKVNIHKKKARVIVGSRILQIVFRELGFLAEAERRRVPEIIMNAPQEIIMAYLKGLINSSGSIDKDGNIAYSIRSPIMARQVFLLLQSIGVNPMLYQNSSITITISRSFTRTPPAVYMYLTNDAISVDLVLQNVSTRMTASRSQMLMLENKQISTVGEEPSLFAEGSSNYEVEGDVMPTMGDVTLTEIIDIEEEYYDGYVYDFAVPGDNSFVGGYGIVYHNSDPYGWYIYSVFKVGSIQLSFESIRLATPKARFLGVSMSDVFGDKGRRKKPWLSERERRSFVIKATDRDIARAKELMRYEWFKTKDWLRELKIFLKKKVKLEIEAMASKGLRFLADEYIPRKIETGDWIV